MKLTFHRHMMEGKHSKRDSGHHENEQLRQGAMHGDFDPLDGGKHNSAAGRLGGTTAEEANQRATMAEREHASGVGSKTAAAAGAAGIAGQTRSHGNVRGVEESDRLRSETKLSDRHDRHSSSSSGASGAGLEKKPSLMDRINPMKDADGDGKKGFMK